MDRLLVVAGHFDELAASLNSLHELLFDSPATGARLELARAHAQRAAELIRSQVEGAGGSLDAVLRE